MKVVPIKTRILTARDDIVKVIAEYTRGQVAANDVIAVAESVLAITQGRVKRPEEMRPCFLAKILCRFFPQKGSISAWHSMQALMEEEGQLRVLCALIIGFLAKLTGRPGVFYRLAGEQARLIDDVTGTMPPFDKYIVYGPKDPAKAAESVRIATGCHGAAIVDVNDLQRVAVLGVSAGLDAKDLAGILRDNPFGNDSQKTPIVIIKNYAEQEGA